MTLRRRTPLKPVSDKRRREDAEREQMLLDTYGPREARRCHFKDFVYQAGFDLQITEEEQRRLLRNRCFGEVHGHELRKSSQGGSRTDPKNVVPLCDHHNGWVEDEPELAHRTGLAIRAGDTPLE